MMKPVATFFKSFRWYDWTMLAAIVVFATILILQRMDSDLLPKFLRPEQAEAPAPAPEETGDGNTPEAANANASSPDEEVGNPGGPQAGQTKNNEKKAAAYMYGNYGSHGNYGGHGMYKRKYRDMDYDM